MAYHKKIIALGCEFVGLATILLATLWQVFFTNQMDSTLANWQFHIQQEMSYRTLWSISDLSQQILAGSDAEKTRDLANTIDQRTSRAVDEAIGQRDDRAYLSGGQANIFFWIRSGLFVLGSFLILLGKWFAFRDVLQPSSKESPIIHD